MTGTMTGTFTGAVTGTGTLTGSCIIPEPIIVIVVQYNFLFFLEYTFKNKTLN